jgi:hypothetical protein
MASINISTPEKAGYYHFLYRTTDPVDGRWYGGKRSTRKHPAVDRYIGSGNWVKAHPDRKRLQREIVSLHASSADVFAAEGEWITWDLINSDPLCMNLRDGGEGVTVEAALLRYAEPVERARHAEMLRRIGADPAVRAKKKASALRRFENPEQLALQTAHMQRITSDPVLLAKAQAARDTPEWRANVLSALEARRAADPNWRAKVKAGMLALAADPIWYQARAAENRRMATDPAWRAAQAAGTAKRTADPVWRETMRRMHAARRASKAAISN